MTGSLMKHHFNLPTFDLREALCAQTDPEAFFPGPDSYWTTPRYAKEICGRCPVKLDCLAWALENNEREGVWGGTTPKERQRLRKNMGLPKTYQRRSVRI